MPNVTINSRIFNVAEIYQPLYGIDTNDIQRNCDDRLRTIIQAEEGLNDNKLINEGFADWGSSLGFFTMSLGKLSQEKIYGIDHDKQNIDVANALKDYNKIENISFITGKIPDDVPDTKNHLILSVLHHDQKTPSIPDKVLDKIKDANTIYFELAHYNEWPDWSKNLIPARSEMHRCPYLLWLETLEKQLPDFTIRLIGVHATHLGTLRPMFICKKKISEKLNDLIIYDRFKLPYIDYGDNTIQENGERTEKRYKSDTTYAYAFDTKGINLFLKFKDNELIETLPFIKGLLLSDIRKFGMLPWYDRESIKKQLVPYIETLPHGDPHAWNFIVNEDSQITPIDITSPHSAYCDACKPLTVKHLIQSI